MLTGINVKVMLLYKRVIIMLTCRSVIFMLPRKCVIVMLLYDRITLKNNIMLL